MKPGIMNSEKHENVRRPSAKAAAPHTSSTFSFSWTYEFNDKPNYRSRHAKPQNTGRDRDEHDSDVIPGTEHYKLPTTNLKLLFSYSKAEFFGRRLFGGTRAFLFEYSVACSGSLFSLRLAVTSIIIKYEFRIKSWTTSSRVDCAWQKWMAAIDTVCFAVSVSNKYKLEEREGRY